ncbi:MAG TPA: GNAT family N-acetyltransferase [Ktedonobacterales bacterium]|jgi:ribosomal protein S18 acetylase RimI-like enzyme
MASASEIAPQPSGTFWMLHLEGPLPGEVKPRLSAQFARVDAEAAPALAQAMGLAEAAPVLERFARQCRCYGAWVDGTLAAYGWVTFDEEQIGELGLRVRLPPGEAYIWNCATLPAYRGQHLYPALLTYISRELRREGFQRILIGADSDNLPSQKGMARAGFQPVADILLAPTRTKGQMWLQGRPGVSERLITHLRQALTDDEGRLL